MTGASRRIVQGVSFVLALALLVWLLDGIGWQRIGGAFGRVGLQGALLLLFMGVLDLVFDGGALWFAVGRRGGPRVVSSNALGSVINQLIPFEVGEAVKAGLLRTRIGTNAAVSGTIFWNYLFKLSRPMVAAAAALVGFLGPSGLPREIAGLLLVAAVAAVIPFLALRFVLRRGAASLVIRVVRKLPILGRRATGLLETARQIDGELHRIRRERRGDYLAVLLLQMGGRLAGWLYIYLAGRLLDLSWSFALASGIYAALVLADYVAMIMPARLGVGEGAAFGMFKLLSLDPSVGLLLGVIGRLKSLAAGALLGLPALVGAPPLRQVVKTGAAAGSAAAPPSEPLLAPQRRAPAAPLVPGGGGTDAPGARVDAPGDVRARA
jgi:hypothetical protein